MCEWIGNSPWVAREHSLQVTDEHFARPLQNPMHQPPARGRKTAQGVRKARENPSRPGPRTNSTPGRDSTTLGFSGETARFRRG